jgi:hypothetical protein
VAKPYWPRAINVELMALMLRPSAMRLVAMKLVAISCFSFLSEFNNQALHGSYRALPLANISGNKTEITKTYQSVDVQLILNFASTLRAVCNELDVLYVFLI